MNVMNICTCDCAMVSVLGKYLSNLNLNDRLEPKSNQHYRWSVANMESVANK